MGISYKNFWSLNTDEAVVAGILRDGTNKKVEVLMPLNAQMKGVDLFLMNVQTKKVITIQVKGSRAYEPKKKELEKWEDGSLGWFFFDSKKITEATADYFAFLIYVIERNDLAGRRLLKPHTILIPTNVLKRQSLKYKRVHGKNQFSYLIWVNPRTKRAFDFRDIKIDFSKYLDNKGMELMNKRL